MDSLTGHAGSWTGTNQFRLMPTDDASAAPAAATLSVDDAGTIATLAYTWTHPDDGPQSGHLMVGLGEEPATAQALWGDSWHQKPAVRVLRGTVLDDGVHLSCEYFDGWFWHIVLTAPDPATLRLQMDNTVPGDDGRDGVSYWAMLADLHRT